jgi:hypothetical protein
MKGLAEFQQRIANWRRSPSMMAEQEFGFTPDRWQHKAFEAFADPTKRVQRISLQACVGPGKTAVEVICALNFLGCYAEPGEHPSGLALSESQVNLSDNFWKELAKWRGRSAFFTEAFDLTNTRLFAREHPKTWFIAARSYNKAADQEAQGRSLSGLHSKYIAYFIDESGDIPPAVGRAAEQGMGTCTWGRILQGGNPSSHEGMLYYAATHQPHLWVIIRITGDPDDPDRSPRVPLEWAREQIAAWGRDNAWVKYAILGVFPDQSVNALLGPDDVASAMARHLQPDVYAFQQKRLGIDVARFGDDSTVIFPRQGRWASAPVEMRGARSEVIAARVVAAKQRWSSELETIDDTGGWGAGTIDACRLGGVNLLPINAGGKADDPRFFNKKAEMQWRLAEWVKSGGVLPQNPQLTRELVANRYWFEKGQFRVLEKAQLKKALNGKSPDFADALALTFALVEMPSGSAQLVGSPTEGSGFQVAHEWNPFTGE